MVEQTKYFIGSLFFYALLWTLLVAVISFPLNKLFEKARRGLEGLVADFLIMGFAAVVSIGIIGFLTYKEIL